MTNTDVLAPIGVFDSGLGGLTVLRSCLTKLPHERFIYLGDTARLPYGSKGSETIRRYAKECTEFLLSQNVKLLIVACNTASAHALSDLIAQCSCPVIGTIDPAVIRAVEATKNNIIGVIGTEATVACGVYESSLRNLKPTMEVHSVACPLLVPLVEQGMFDGEIVDKVIELYLAELKEARIDTLILGCTHYPLLMDAIQKYMGASVRLIACSDTIADTTKSILDSQHLANTTQRDGEIRYFVTDAVQRFNRLGAALLDMEEIKSKQIVLPISPER